MRGDVARRQIRSGDSDARGLLAPASPPLAPRRVDLSDTTLLDLLPHAAFVVAVDGDDTFRFEYANDALLALLGSAEGATGDLRSVLPAHALVSFVRAFARAASELQTVGFEADWGGTTPRRVLSVEVAPVVDEDGRCRHLIGAAHEITEHRHAEVQLAHRTRHDPITELPNRVMLVEWLEDALTHCENDRCIGLVVLDVDHFKIVNDSLGHTAGDELLGVIASRVDRVLRGGDKLARLGGDELAIVCHNARTVEDVATLARRIRSVFDEVFVLESGDEVYLGASLGVAASIGHNDTPARLLRDADVAMFAAKELGRGRIELFDDAMRERAVSRLETEGSLRRALLRGEFRVHYQPLVHFERSEVIGFEALVRWEHPVRGLLPPAEFLEIAEETGLIVPIGAWVLQEACAQAARWSAESPDSPNLTVSVNLSARQLSDPELVSTVEGALASVHLDPALLVLEVTESMLMEDADRAVDVLQKLAKQGVRVGIDDFGTGQSSLGYLKSLPVHTLKIDRSFVDGLGHDHEDHAIVAAVVSLGHSLGLTVLAEGIENSAQLAELRSLGCDLGQGYYFAYPQPGEVVRALVHHRFRWSGRESA
jgi:diguanylate cyclase (GGDEF)-like protein